MVLVVWTMMVAQRDFLRSQDPLAIPPRHRYFAPDRYAKLALGILFVHEPIIYQSKNNKNTTNDSITIQKSHQPTNP
jgi:hypothetical protein